MMCSYYCLACYDVFEMNNQIFLVVSWYHCHAEFVLWWPDGMECPPHALRFLPRTLFDIHLTVLELEMYKIRYFLTVKYFGNISVFNEIFQNATSLCPTCFFLPQGASAHI